MTSIVTPRVVGEFWSSGDLITGSGPLYLSWGEVVLDQAGTATVTAESARCVLLGDFRIRATRSTPELRVSDVLLVSCCVAGDELLQPGYQVPVDYVERLLRFRAPANTPLALTFRNPSRFRKPISFSVGAYASLVLRPCS